MTTDRPHLWANVVAKTDGGRSSYAAVSDTARVFPYRGPHDDLHRAVIMGHPCQSGCSDLGHSPEGSACGTPGWPASIDRAGTR